MLCARDHTECFSHGNTVSPCQCLRRKAPESPFLIRESRLRAGQHPTKFTSLGAKAERGLILPSTQPTLASLSQCPAQGTQAPRSPCLLHEHMACIGWASLPLAPISLLALSPSKQSSAGSCVPSYRPRPKFSPRQSDRVTVSECTSGGPHTGNPCYLQVPRPLATHM